MPKHAKKNQKRKRTVKKNADKLKEITARDILLNPALVHSPQFKALPIEKQIQLMAQVKQLQQLLGKGTAITGGSGAADQMYSKLLNANSNLNYAQNETQRIKNQIEETKKQTDLEYKAQKDLKNDLHNYKQNLKHQKAMDNITLTRSKLNCQFNTDQINFIDNQLKRIQNTPEQKHATKRKEDLQNAIYEGQQYIANAASGDEERARELYELSAIESQRKMNKLFKALSDDQELRNQMLDQIAVYQQVANAYTENGDEAKANQTEESIVQMNNDLKAPVDNEVDTNINNIANNTDNDNDNVNDNNEPASLSFVNDFVDDAINTALSLQKSTPTVHDQVIDSNAQILTLKDTVNALEENLKQKQKLKQQEELAQLSDSHMFDCENDTKRMIVINDLLAQVNEKQSKIDMIMYNIKDIKDSTHSVEAINGFNNSLNNLRKNYMKINKRDS